MELHKNCPKGYSTRRSYTRKNGVSVRETCVPVIKSNTRKVGEHISCKEGDIPKASYIRKGKHGHPSVYVPPTCVRGSSRIGLLRKGDLKAFGYKYDLPVEVRHQALEKAMNKYGILETWHKLEAISNLTKITNPVPASKFKEDADWILSIYNKQKDMIQ